MGKFVYKNIWTVLLNSSGIFIRETERKTPGFNLMYDK